MERRENRARFIAIRNENKYFSAAVCTRPEFLKFRLSRENGASNKQRTRKYFDEYISRANDSRKISFRRRIARRSALN